MKVHVGIYFIGKYMPTVIVQRKEFQEVAMAMNEAEKRRKELLAQARTLYSEEHMSDPAVHPRCKGAYGQLYGKEEPQVHSTFVLRVCVSLMLFLLFAGMDYEKTSVGECDSEKIIQAITEQQPLGELLK